MENKGLVRKSNATPAFVENAMQSIDNMMQYAEVLLASGLCPSHFYEKGNDKKPDLTRGKPAAVVMVLQYGMEIGLSPIQSLQQLVPVNGLVSIKGDGAKPLIFGSGLCLSWKEEEQGSIGNEDYTFTIISKRKDNGIEMTRSFSVEEAKRAGLWVTRKQAEGADGWKHRLSPWYKYPKRMVMYRCIGFISRDLYGDVINGAYTLEEAQDMTEPEMTEVITPSGTKVTIPDTAFNKERSGKITNKVTSMIDKKNVKLKKEIPSSIDIAKEEAVDVAPEETNNMVPGDNSIYTEEDLVSEKSTDLLNMVQADEEMSYACDMLGGKYTNKKLRGIILAKQNGTLDELTPENESEETEPEKEIMPDDSFEYAKEGHTKIDVQKILGIQLTEIPEGSDKRSFEEVQALFQALKNQAGIDNGVFGDIVTRVGGSLSNYTNREDFCFRASVDDIIHLINNVG